MFLQEGLEHCLGGFSIVDIPRAAVWGHVIKFKKSHFFRCPRDFVYLSSGGDVGQLVKQRARVVR